MRTRANVLTASLLGALALLPCRAASAQGSEGHVDELPVEKVTTPAVLFSPSLERGWWRAITDALDAMRGLRGRRIPPAAARQVDLRTAPAPTELSTRWLELPPVTQAPLRRWELRVGPVRGMPVPIEPATLSVADARGESGELLGVGVTLPWPVP